jgi:hypothetical protein
MVEGTGLKIWRRGTFNVMTFLSNDVKYVNFAFIF